MLHTSQFLLGAIAERNKRLEREVIKVGNQESN
jgi:hypothetical protein